MCIVGHIINAPKSRLTCAKLSSIYANSGGIPHRRMSQMEQINFSVSLVPNDTCTQSRNEANDRNIANDRNDPNDGNETNQTNDANIFTCRTKR